MNNIGKTVRCRTAGTSSFSLVETVIALAIIALIFVGLTGMLGLGLATNQNSSSQTVATNISESILADLRSTPSFSTNSPRYSLTLPTSTNALSGVTPSYRYFDINQNYVGSSSTSATNAVYVAYVYLTQLVQVGNTNSTSLTETIDQARIVVAWPAAATTPVGSVEILTAFRIN